MAPAATPLAGAFDCDAATPAAGVVWTDRRGHGQLWTDLSFNGGTVAQEVAKFKLPRKGIPVAGDFDGDGCADLLWIGKSKSKIWWGGAAGLKSSSARSLPVGTKAFTSELGSARASVIIQGATPTAWIATGKRKKPFKLGKVKSLKPKVSATAFTDLVNGSARVLLDRPGTAKDRIAALKLRGTTVSVVSTKKVANGKANVQASCGARLISDGPGTANDKESWTESSTSPRSRAVSLPGKGKIAAGKLPNAGCVLVRSGASPGRAEIRYVGSGGSGNPPTTKAPHPNVYMNAANKQRLADLITSGDTAALRFKNMVDNQVAGSNYYGFEPWYSALLGAITGDPKYCVDAVARTEAWVTGEEALIAAGQRAEVAGDSYLEVGPYIGSLAMTFDWCHDNLSQSQRTRWINYANQAVWNVWNNDDAVWGGVAYPWSGWSVDNPSNNYYYSFLRATMLLGLSTRDENPLAAGWLTKFRTEKIGMQLVPTFNSDLSGGGSREGTGYGTAMKNLFSLYDIWAESTGERISDLTPHTKASIPYLMHETVPGLDRIAPIGDHARDSTATLFDYHREYGLALAWLYRDDPISAPLRGWLAANAVPQMGNYFEYVYDFLYRDPGAPTAPLADLSTAYFAPGAGDLFSRSSWQTNATWMSMRMGPYTESHAHHDQLSLLINQNGWLAYDANIDSHSGIEQDEENHNLVRINHGATQRRQREGYSSTVHALADNETFTYAAADATPVYNPANVSRVQREVVFLKPNVFVVYDRLNAGAGATFTWQLNTPTAPTIIGAASAATYTPSGMSVQTVKPFGSPQSSVDLAALPGDDFTGGHRYEVSQSASGATAFLHVIQMNGAVNSISFADTATADGVQLALNNGGTATVHFTRDQLGGDMTLSGAAGSFSGVLPTGIQSLALFAP